MVIWGFKLNTMKLQITILVLLSFALLSCSTSNTNSDKESAKEVVEEDPRWLNFYPDADNDKNKKIVFISGDEEYRSEEALPMLAKILSKHHGFTCTVLFSQNPETPGIIDPTYLKNIPGLENLDKSDLMVIFTRFRAVPDEQMVHVDNYLKSGRPVIGIRTATHAFLFDSTSSYQHYSNGYNGPETEWKDGFGRFVLGEKWISHHGHHRHQSTRGIIAEGAENHPIVTGIASGEIWGPTDVYGVRLPMLEGTQPIILGQVVNRAGEYDENDPFYGLKETDTEVAAANPARKESANPNDPMMPVTWTRTYKLPDGKPGKVFTSTVGSSTDMVNDAVRRLYVNAVYWSLDLKVPEKAKVDIVGNYNPSAYSFIDKAVWKERSPKVADKR